MQRRPAQTEELPGLVSRLCAWVASAGRPGYCHPAALPVRVLEHPGPPGRLVVWEDGSATAAIAVLGRFGSVFDAFVAPGLRGTRAETLVVGDAAASTAGPSGGGPVETEAFEEDLVRVAVLERLGFAPAGPWDEIRTRRLERLPPVEPPAGVRIRRATPGDAGALAELRAACFGERWTAAAYRATVMERPGRRPGFDLVAVSGAGEVVGTAGLHPCSGGDGLLEPVCTAPSHRRRGIGRALVAASLRGLAAAGMTSASVEHAAGDVAAARLYESLGFKVRHRTEAYRRA